MFLCTLSVLVSLVAANSSAHQGQLKAIESEVTRNRYNVPQEIRNQVPVDFAALNLRKSRLKHLTDKNTSQNRPVIDKRPKAPNNQPKRINVMKNSYKLSKYKKYNGPTNKKPIDESVGLEKSSQLPRTSLPDEFTSTESPIVFSTEIIIETTKTSTVESQPTISSESKSNNLANINRAMNALPQEIVTVVRDEIDCNDDPSKNFKNIRGPPCTFSRRSPGSNGHSSFWMKNIFPHNWGAFTG